MQAIFGRKGAVDHGDIADETAVENLAEARDAIGKKDAVDPILNVGVLVANMERAGRRGILRKSGGLQQNLVERRIVALRQGGDGGLPDIG